MRDVLRDARRSFPFIERIFADAGYQGPKAAKTVAVRFNPETKERTLDALRWGLVPYGAKAETVAERHPSP